MTFPLTRVDQPPEAIKPDPWDAKEYPITTRNSLNYRAWLAFKWGIKSRSHLVFRMAAMHEYIFDFKQDRC